MVGKLQEINQNSTMPRQRSKKLSESRESKSKLAPSKVVQSGSNESDNKSEEEREKDEDEAELDRLVLGDGGEFMAELGGNMDDDVMSASEADLEAQLGLGEKEQGLEGVDDADVSITAADFVQY